MKRAKLMLTSLAVLAVVGGAMAFQAKHFANKKLFCNDNNNHCILTTPGFTTVINLNPTTTDPCADGSGSWSTISNQTKSCTQSGTVYETLDL